MLITLAYRLPRAHAGAVLGTVTAYPLTQDFSDAWATLPTGRSGKQPRYSSLATGLCAAAGQPVRLFGERDLAQQELDTGNRMLLLTSHLFDYRLAVAVTAWERHTRADHTHSTLAQLLPPPEPARRQQTGDDDPPLVLALTAIRATSDPSAARQAFMYSERRSGWLRLGAGIADFHANSIGDPALGRTEEKAARTRDRVEERLAQLADDHPGMPIVIFTDGPSTRTIWPGLQDRHFGDGPMPGDSLRAAGGEVAVVRSNHGPEIGRPVTRQDEGNQPRDPLQPAAPGRRVYRRTDTPAPVWLFPGISRTYGAMGGATGARYTRWTLPAHLTSQLRKPWHSYTGTEIAIPCPGTWEPAALVALTARLCEQPVSWGGRVVYATPLHLAVTSDKDHPDYREVTARSDMDTDDETGLTDDDEGVEDHLAGESGPPDSGELASAGA